MVNTQPINFFFSEIEEQEAEPALLLADSLKNYHKEGTGNAAYQHLVKTEEVKEWAKKLSLGSKFVTNWNEYCVPYPIIVCAEALFRVCLLEMFHRHTTLNICMYIHKYMYMNKERKKEREEKVERETRLSDELI